ncbi:hypothetical protein U9M48_038307, partial [Paspalum notatum var. saurae]
MIDTTLIEFDLKIKIGMHEKDDLQLIDGVSTIDDMVTWRCRVVDCSDIASMAIVSNSAFDGAIGESGGLKRSVVVVVLGAQMDLKFKVAANLCTPADHYHCCFKVHGHATRDIKTDFALI